MTYIMSQKLWKKSEKVAPCGKDLPQGPPKSPKPLIQSSKNHAKTGLIGVIEIFGMAAMPILCRDLSLLPKLSCHSLAVYLPILYFFFLEFRSRIS